MFVGLIPRRAELLHKINNVSSIVIQRKCINHRLCMPAIPVPQGLGLFLFLTVSVFNDYNVELSTK